VGRPAWRVPSILVTSC